MSTLIIIGVVGLVLLYMMYPRFLRRRLSAAQFFNDLPQPRQAQSRLKRGKLELTLPFFLQLAVLLLILAAILFPDKKIEGSNDTNFGVWFVVDTSASMSTIQQDRERLAEISKKVDLIINQVRQVARGREFCFRFSTFDMERRDLIVSGNETDIQQILKNLKTRPLGTDLRLIHNLLNMLNKRTSDEKQCPVSHLVVITDIPAPAWLEDSENYQVIWENIGTPVGNVGFTEIRASRNLLTGLVSEILLDAIAYGPAPENTGIIITAPDNSIIKDEIIDWQQNGSWHGSYTPMASGHYKIQLTPGGAYSFDDIIEIELNEGQEVRVDWQLPDRQIPSQLGWREDKIKPHFRVTSDLKIPLELPTLLIGNGYGNSRNRNGETGIFLIGDFVENSSLLADINFDAVESLGLKGEELPPGFKPVLRGMDGSVWLAETEHPLRALIPGLPTGTDDTLGRFSAAVFFNAVRWLMQNRTMKPLYTLTSPYSPEPTVNRLVLHKGEGNTWREPENKGKIDNLIPLMGKKNTIPLWPVLVMIAVIIFTFERFIAIYMR